jgi:murein L,D-transpeptidase YcbB/YkuD
MSSFRISYLAAGAGLLLACSALADESGPAPAVDYAQTGAIAPQGAQARLDLAPPPGLQPELPPDPPPPAFVRQGAVESPAPARVDVSGDAAPPAADVLGAAIADGLERLVATKPAGRPVGAADWTAARQAIAAVYAERGSAPLWLEGAGFSDRARQAMARLARAADDGLDLSATPAPAATLPDASPPTLAEADIALSAAVVAYAMQASGARINPRALSKDVTARPEVADPASALKSVAAAADPDAALAAFNPPQAGYRALRDALAELRAQAARTASRLAPGPVLKLGMSDPRVPLIRSRFGLNAPGEPEVYDVRVASAVAAFQRVHGLPVNGSLTEATATALERGVGSAGRERLIRANMEMWRWEPRDMGAARVEVNVPDFSLKLTSGGAVLFRTRVIVGKPDTPTPIFSNSIKYMLFNPVWRVPDSIIKKEMEPKLAEDPNYFERHGYKVSYVGDKLVVQQPPGEANALGRMLFLFPNEHAVYLHDTPGRGLFQASYRALSHGCVRVEDPSRLAEILMGGAPRGWTEAKVRSLLGDKERTFSLPVPVPVHLQYFTIFANDAGRLEERSDLYGLTAKVAGALPN